MMRPARRPGVPRTPTAVVLDMTQLDNLPQEVTEEEPSTQRPPLRTGIDPGAAAAPSDLLPDPDVAGRREAYRGELIEEVLHGLRSYDLSGSAVTAPLLATFARTFLKRVDERYLFGHPIEHLLEQLRDSLAALRVRRPNEIQVRVFNPTMEEHGYTLGSAIIETVMKDQPFIYDTLLLFCQTADIKVKKTVNIILPVRRDEDGVVDGIGSGVESAVNESYCRLIVEPIAGREVCEVFRQELQNRLRLATMMVRDFYRMLKITKDLTNDYEFLPRVHPERARWFEEARAFLQWLTDDHFIFMGISHYRPDEGGAVRVMPADGFGIVAGNRQPSGFLTEETTALFRLDRPLDPPFIQVRKAMEESLVHRAGKIDEVLVRTMDDDGNPSGGIVIHGLFTFKAIASHGGQIPILRAKLQQILKDEETIKESYLYKSIINAFNALPVEYLFDASLEDIKRLIRTTLRSEREHQIFSHISIDTEKKSAYLFVVLPKEVYGDELRVKIQKMVESQLGATYSDHRVAIGKYKAVILHFYLTGGESFHAVEERALEADIVALCSPWPEQLRRALHKRHDADRAQELFERYGSAFPERYKAATTAQAALVDIERLEELSGGRPLTFDLFRSPGEDNVVELRIYETQNIYLTDILPILDNFGLRVIKQSAVTVHTTDVANRVLDRFRLDVSGFELDLVEEKERFIEALYAVFERRMANDRLNCLVTLTGVSWAEVDLIRAYLHYSRLLAAPVAHDTVQSVLIDNPTIFETLVELFRAKFAPEGGELRDSDSRRAKVAGVKDRLFEQLKAIKSFTEDRVLRGFFNLIDATLRTNFYRTDRPFHYISVKLDCPRVEGMSDPRPRYEMYVHHVDMEGVHLRGGKVARGGIRWSDRIDDYRNEILGLMLTQMVKNTLIVPVGAKGGFILKSQYATADERRRAADEMYKVLIRGLLDVVDNRVDGAIVPPPQVVRYDEDDPYLVVAADKGTAHLSDTANSVAIDYGFWLGDAFASGGSSGYDHKKMKITAAGAWECVKRHFREMDINPEEDVITVVGIGDMSGDVFGNGLLLSKTVKLVAAFNHMHIFLDPDPDPAQSWVERKRLFDLPRSSWADYDTTLISKGGGVFDRQAKAIELTPEVRALLDVTETVLSGEELIHEMLKMRADLLWNGGIGTYIKSELEDHRDVGDKANDRVRINPDQLRVKVVGEGGNLGATQRGRIEVALRGVRINTDAVDNAGGVNLSDHEVNLKVLFSPMVGSGGMSIEERDRILREVGQEVADDVLRDNYNQSLRLSLDERRSLRDVYAFGRAFHRLKAESVFDPRSVHLPHFKRINARAAAGQGLTGPELSTAGAFMKMWVYRELLRANHQDPESATLFLETYFPKTVWERFRDEILAHMLVHEIVCTVQTNFIVDFAGVTFMSEVMHETGRAVPDIARAYVLANDLLGMWSLKQQILDLDWKVAAETQYEALMLIEESLRAVTVWLLGELPEAQLAAMNGARLETLRKGVLDVNALAPACLSETERDRVTGELERFVQAGLPADVAMRLKTAFIGGAALPILHIAEQTGADLEKVADVYFAVGDALKLLELARKLNEHVTEDRWEAMAMAGLRRTFAAYHVELTRRAVVHLDRKTTGVQAIRKMERGSSALVALSADLAAVSRDGFRLAALVVLSERFRKVVQAS